ncbi:hypothetical protein HanRHA438_Chr03g0103731 [Helianthus annuus]|nr:hypothetical protein HanHA89_Chr03g0088661 [Helianthus annuus]KAJ0766808.1 hypothetical protein HanLR1_Chr03g0081831 [Helianthus annuus]KAJ0934112.1 hypothetical protein HanRHA438_Chr03g0103731 [Helianthus annuus]
MLLCLVYDICFKSPSTRTNQLTIGFCYSATNFTRYQLKVELGYQGAC